MPSISVSCHISVVLSCQQCRVLTHLVGVHGRWESLVPSLSRKTESRTAILSKESLSGGQDDQTCLTLETQHNRRPLDEESAEAL